MLKNGLIYDVIAKHILRRLGFTKRWHISLWRCHNDQDKSNTYIGFHRRKKALGPAQLQSVKYFALDNYFLCDIVKLEYEFPNDLKNGEVMTNELPVWSYDINQKESGSCAPSINTISIPACAQDVFCQ